ncbi:MAG: hypothetical protein V3U32_06475 [Anaerolineales bacterium]
MQIRCYRCGWSFAIKKEEAAFALEALEETGGTHYDSNCPRCRHSNRISLEQLKKASPRAGEELVSAELQDTGEEVTEDDRELEPDRELEADRELKADRELEAEAARPETDGQEAQAKSEKTESKRRRRKRR